MSEPDTTSAVASPAGNGGETFLDRWILAFGRVFSFVFMISGIVIVYEVVARYLFDAPTIWGHETTTFLCAIAFAYGGNHCLANNGHIRIVVLYERVSPAWRRAFDLFNIATGILWGVMMAWATWFLVQKSWLTPFGGFHMETSGSAWDPPFPALIKGFLLLCMVLMTLQYILRLVRRLGGRR